MSAPTREEIIAMIEQFTEQAPLWPKGKMSQAEFAGRLSGLADVFTAHLNYQDRTAMNFLGGRIAVLEQEFQRRRRRVRQRATKIRRRKSLVEAFAELGFTLEGGRNSATLARDETSQSYTGRNFEEALAKLLDGIGQELGQGLQTECHTYLRNYG